MNAAAGLVAATAGQEGARIGEVTGASSTTISRVSRSLNYGADGYRAVLDAAGAGPADDERPGE